MALSDYNDIRSALLIKMDVPSLYPLNTPGTLTFSDAMYDIEYDSATYTGLGRLLSVSATSSELRTSSNQVTVTISGIPNSSTREIIESEFKTANIRIWRAFFAQTGEWIDDSTLPTNPVGKFKGFVNSISYFEDWDSQARVAANTIQFDCQSYIDILAKKTAGRQTNPRSMKQFYPTDTSFDRTPTIAGSKWNFGVIQR